MPKIMLVEADNNKQTELKADFSDFLGYENIESCKQLEDINLENYRNHIFATYSLAIVEQIQQYFGIKNVNTEFYDFSGDKNRIYCVGTIEAFYNFDTNDTNYQIDCLIDEVFLTLGLRRNLLGSVYLKCAIKMAIKRPYILMRGITTQLYPKIAEKFKTSASKVERSIRHALETCYDNEKFTALNDLFKIKVFAPHDKPSNGEFIALIADKIKLKINEKGRFRKFNIA